jgi:hypothetical protein
VHAINIMIQLMPGAKIDYDLEEFSLLLPSGSFRVWPVHKASFHGWHAAF